MPVAIVAKVSAGGEGNRNAMLVGAELRRTVSFGVTVALSIGFTVAASLAVSPEVASATGFSCRSGAPSYTVRSGDGWFVIADRVGVSARTLLEANGAALDDVLLAGDRVCLPAGADLAGACGNSYSVRSGDGWFPIASRFGVSVNVLLSANDATLDEAVHPGQTICLPDGASTTGGSTSSAAGAAGGSNYTVARGDSWFGIAERAGVSARSLLAANDATSDDVIVPGDTVRLPAGAKQPSSSASPRRFWVELDAMPTQGPCGFGDTWLDGRGGGRRHKGVDIFTKKGDYVYAVADGRLTARGWDQPGRISGNAWTLTTADGTFYYYSHLADFNPALSVGSRVRAGQIIGWVGATGNASSAHLHFEIHPDGGEAVNPYPILRAQGGCNDGRPYTQPGGWVPDRKR